MNKKVDTSENIQNTICNDKITNPLFIRESIKLAKVISIYVDMQIIVERELCFKSGAKAYDYLKKFGIIF